MAGRIAFEGFEGLAADFAFSLCIGQIRIGHSQHCIAMHIE
jgi:hypothetical protein